MKTPDTTLLRAHARRLTEELLAYDEIEAQLGVLSPVLVDARAAAQAKLDAVDHALIEFDRRLRALGSTQPRA